MQHRTFTLLGICLLLGACATGDLSQFPGEGYIKGGVYVNQTYGVVMHFEKPEGWQFLTTPSDVSHCGMQTAIFCARNMSRLLTFWLTMEDGGFEMSNADYQTSIEVQMAEEWGEKLERLSLQELDGLGSRVLVWTYRLDGDVMTQAFYRRGTLNFRLVFLTPDGAYPRRQAEITDILRSVDVNPVVPAGDRVSRTTR